MQLRAPRYTRTPFPPYRFIPGTGQPHPICHPEGHSYVPQRERVPAVVHIDPTRWEDCSSWLHGIDLYNHGYWWEAHESWEDVWRGFERKTPLERLLRGLIQAAACHIKIWTGQERGAATLASGAHNHLRAAAADWDDETMLGLEVRGFAAAFTDYAAARRGDPPLRHDERRYPYLELPPRQQAP